MDAEFHRMLSFHQRDFFEKGGSGAVWTGLLPLWEAVTQPRKAPLKKSGECFKDKVTRARPNSIADKTKCHAFLLHPPEIANFSLLFTVGAPACGAELGSTWPGNVATALFGDLDGLGGSRTCR